MEIHRLARPPDTLGEGSYTFTQTTRIVTNESERSSSTTTTYRVSMFRFHDQFIQIGFTFNYVSLIRHMKNILRHHNA